jgi:hypothetical protein
MASKLVSTFIICVPCFVHAAPLLGERDLSGYSYDLYENEFGRNHVGDERIKRKQIFNTNLDAIRTHNADPSKSWFAAVNEFTDLTRDEFKARQRHRPHLPARTHVARESHVSVPVGGLPESVDWRMKPGVVTPVKNQGACGSCYAFSATETLESHLAIATGTAAPKLSPQQIVSCAGIGGCGGSNQPLAFNYTSTAGITTEEHYPYSGTESTCDATQIKPVAKNSGYTMLPVNDYMALMEAVATKGPVAISVAADDRWQMYGGGIVEKGGFDIDHAVQLVGYGEENGVMYWTVRNSWGDWGENGYIRLKRFGEGQEPCGGDQTFTVCGVDGILSSSSYPTDVVPVGGEDSVVV